MRIFKKIGSLKITLTILLALAFSSILGTLISQGQSDQFYMQKYGLKTGSMILFLQADDFFNSIYYNLLLFCLALNLFLCTINSFRFIPHALKTPALKPGMPASKTGEVSLLYSGGKVNLRDSAQKPRALARVSFIFLKDRRKLAIFLLHCGVLIVFLGALVSKFTKQSQRYTLFADEKVVLPDENAEIIFKQFTVEYYPGRQTPKEYRSRVELFDGGVFKSEYSLRVNHPLKYKGFSFYQSSFEVLADVEIRIKHLNKVIWEGLWEHGRPLEVSGKNNLRFKMTHFLPDVSVDNQGRILSRSYTLGNAAMLISAYRKKEMVYEQWVFPSAENMNGLNPKEGNFEFEVKKIKPVYAAVIQVTKDPGWDFVMGGFALMFCGMLLLLLKKKLSVA
ncbi:MAG: cytochrome c biogenesis protein ResB [Candidatus Omnitrophica bacterium]|nr:cytochrome c biogenesis protein ResB [Candidatus Omnitrophota bacterium]